MFGASVQTAVLCVCRCVYFRIGPGSTVGLCSCSAGRTSGLSDADCANSHAVRKHITANSHIIFLLFVHFGVVVCMWSFNNASGVCCTVSAWKHKYHKNLIWTISSTSSVDGLVSDSAAVGCFSTTDVTAWILHIRHVAATAQLHVPTTCWCLL